MRFPLTKLRRDPSGLILVEVVVSAMLLVIVALGVFTAFDAGTRATAEERHRARAHALAEADVERMREMRVADLAGLDQTRTTTVDGLTYTIRSQAAYGTETATTSTCSTGAGSRDTLLVSSTVTWPSIGGRPPVKVSSVVAPPNGSTLPNSGSLLVSIKDSRGTGVAGVSISGSGATSFTGTTGTGGCVMVRNLQAGNYMLSFGGAAIGKVTPDGIAPGGETASVVAGSTNTVNFEFDSPGRIQDVQFRTRDYPPSNGLRPMAWDSIVVGHTSMQSPRAFTSTTGRQLTMSTPPTLFPFVTPYTVYAGTCGGNDPGGGLGTGSVVVPVGSSVTGPTIQLPSLLVTVWSGTSSNPGSPVAGSRVSATDPTCNVTRTLTTATNASGRVPDDASGRPMTGLPYLAGSPQGPGYTVCASDAAQNRRRVVTNVGLTSVGAAGTVLNMYLGGGGLQNGNCP